MTASGDPAAATDAARLREVVASIAPDSTPAQRVATIKAFFDDLDPAAAPRLARSAPELVGNLDGAPFPLRYQANRIRMSADRDALGDLLDSGVISPDEHRRYQTLNSLLEVGTVERIDPASGYVRSDVRERTFAVYDADAGGGTVRAVELVGELTSASQVVVWVPGMLINIDGMDGQVAGVNRVRDAAGPDQTAGVVWLGYDIPQIPEVLTVLADERAVAGGERLCQFDAALERETAPDARVTLLAHSYGSVVAGEALRRGAQFDNVIVTGSPGMGRDVDSSEFLGVAENRFFAMGTRNDPVRHSEWHGPDPVRFADAVRLETGSVRWHGDLTGYLRPGSEALANIGRVVRSDYAALTGPDGTFKGDAWWAEPFRGAAHAARKVYDGVGKIGDFLGGARDTGVGAAGVRLDRYAPGEVSSTGTAADTSGVPANRRLEPAEVRPLETIQGERAAPTTARGDGKAEAPPTGGEHFRP